MIKSYSASRTHKLLLNFKPSPDCCLSGIALNDLKNLSKMIVFIWLRNKNGYWFHINSVRGGWICFDPKSMDISTHSNIPDLCILLIPGVK